jgi:hypothetical protein
MLSKQGYLSDRDGHCARTSCFFCRKHPLAWGAGLSDSPIFAFNDAVEHLTVFLVPIGQWSDGAAAPTTSKAEH